MGEAPNECNLLFYFVPFVFFVDELPFLGLLHGLIRGEKKMRSPRPYATSEIRARRAE